MKFVYRPEKHRYKSNNSNRKLVRYCQYYELFTWFDDKKEFHRVDGPAHLYSDGSLLFYEFGIKHRKDNKPAMIFPSGTILYFDRSKIIEKMYNA